MIKYEAIGGIAVARGYVTYDQLRECLHYQEELKSRGGHQLIGMIMLDKGYITNDQLIELLRCHKTAKAATV